MSTNEIEISWKMNKKHWKSKIEISEHEIISYTGHTFIGLSVG